MNNIIMDDTISLYDLHLLYCGGIFTYNNQGLPWSLCPADWYSDGDSIPILISRLFK